MFRLAGAIIVTIHIVFLSWICWAAEEAGCHRAEVPEGWAGSEEEPVVRSHGPSRLWNYYTWPTTSPIHLHLRRVPEDDWRVDFYTFDIAVVLDILYLIWCFIQTWCAVYFSWYWWLLAAQPQTLSGHVMTYKFISISKCFIY